MLKLSYCQKEGKPYLWKEWKVESHGKVLEAVCAIEMHLVLSCIAVGICRAFVFAISGRLVPVRSAIRGHYPREGHLKQPICTISRNVFCAF